MYAEKERLEYILKWKKQFNTSELKKLSNLLKKTLMYLRQDGLINLLRYLLYKKDTQKEIISNFVCKYIWVYILENESDFPNGYIEFIQQLCKTNYLYAMVEKNTLLLLRDTIKILPLKQSMKCEDKDNWEIKSEWDFLKALVNEEGTASICRRKVLGEQLELRLKMKQKTNGKKEVDSIGIDKAKNDFRSVRNKQIEKLYKRAGYEKLTVNVCSNEGSRMAIGIGEPTTEEVSLHLNFLYGVPELPATAIKGVFSHYCKDNNLDINKQIEWFGDGERQGKIVFIDSIPEQYKIVRDIISNQHGDYYAEDNREFPSKQTANLIYFPSMYIEKMKINFWLHKSLHNDKQEIKSKFNECMESCNFGAKGTVGYGYIKEGEKISD